MNSLITVAFGLIFVPISGARRSHPDQESDKLHAAVAARRRRFLPAEKLSLPGKEGREPQPVPVRHQRVWNSSSARCHPARSQPVTQPGTGVTRTGGEAVFHPETKGLCGREMNSQCPPCSCLEEAAQSNPCSPCAVEQNSQADPCPCQDVCPSCPCDPPQIPLRVTSPSLPTDSGSCAEADPMKTLSSGEEPFTIETPGMCVMTFPLQKSILTVELCSLDTPETFPLCQEERCVTETAGTCLENLEKLSQELPVSALEPCTLEVLELGAEEPCQAQGAILGDPCASQSGISTDPCASTGPCQSQGLEDAGDPKDSRSQTSPRAPFRLNSCTSSIVERCLSRCQSWFRGKK
ncbi:uncharacterized protein LOC121660849 [Corvus kubaryi]|uniref:uncharacterized protein LOC121660849 n=1 Tax=Corvus kubaryi TaxID=68294 RepID=UPI001C050B0E|nr:uncharacterized protein LOC121660849 [Corvus kubaryi]